MSMSFQALKLWTALFLAGLLMATSVARAGRPAAMTYSPTKNHMAPLSQVVDYSFTSGTQVKIGEIEFDLDQCAPSFGAEAELENVLYALHFSWPTKVIPAGNLSIRDSESDTILYQTVLSTLDAPPKEVQASSPTNPAVHLKASGEKVTLDSLIGDQKEREIRFCIESVTDTLAATLCSQPYLLKSTPKGYVFYELNRIIAPTVIYGGTPQSLTGSMPLTKQVPAQLEITSEHGQRFRADFKMVSSSYDSIFAAANGRLVLEGHGQVPARNVLTAEKPKWSVDLSIREPFLYFKSPNGFLIKQPFIFDAPIQVPEKSATVLNPESQHETYRSHVDLYGDLGEIKDVKSAQRSADIPSATEFHWDFDTPQKLHLNRSEITIKNKKGETFIANYEIYRGLPYEVSLNIQGLWTDANSVVILGELKATAWLEQFFSWQNKYLSLHRWGIHLDGFKPLANANNQYGNPVGFTLLQGDLRYSANQGLWSKDEMFGPLFIYQSLKFNATSATMAGAGLFWSRKFPIFMDRPLGNLWSRLRIPKWFELQGNYYFIPGSLVTLGKDFDLLGDVKVFFTPELFGQIGIGYRQYDFINQNDSISVQTNTLNFSLGAGYQF